MTSSVTSEMIQPLWDYLDERRKEIASDAHMSDVDLQVLHELNEVALVLIQSTMEYNRKRLQGVLK